MNKEDIIKRIIPELESKIPNLYEFYSKDDIVVIFDSCQKPSTKDIVKKFMTLIWDRPIRRCSECGKLMCQGFCINQGSAYYCSDDCLYKHFTPYTWLQERDNNDQSYFTKWKKHKTYEDRDQIIEA